MKNACGNWGLLLSLALVACGSGSGGESPAASASAPAAVMAPTITAGTSSPSAQAINLSGGTGVTRVSAQYKASDSPTWLTSGDLASGAATYTYTGLAAATAYDYRLLDVASGTPSNVLIHLLTASAPGGGGGSGGASWDVLRDFNYGTIGATAEMTLTKDGSSRNAFDGAAGNSRFSMEQTRDGSQSAKLSVRAGLSDFGYWGGIINLPSKLAAGDDLWLQLYVYIPRTCDIFTTNGSLKFIRIANETVDATHAGFLDIQLVNDSTDSVMQKNAFRMLKEGPAKWFPFGEPNVVTKDAWHRVSVNVKFGSVSKGDGGTAYVRVWQDGKLLTDGTGMQTLTSPTDVATALYLFTYWNEGAAKDQSLWVDDIRMANHRPVWASDLASIDTAP